jgi:hypothetical protein
MYIKNAFPGARMIGFVVAVFALMVLWLQSLAYTPLTPSDLAYPAARRFTYPDDGQWLAPALVTGDTPAQIEAYFKDKLGQKGWRFDPCGHYWYREASVDPTVFHNVFLYTQVLEGGETLFSIRQVDGPKIAFDCR